jgi:hypothetical protein
MGEMDPDESEAKGPRVSRSSFLASQAPSLRVRYTVNFYMSQRKGKRSVSRHQVGEDKSGSGSGRLGMIAYVMVAALFAAGFFLIRTDIASARPGGGWIGAILWTFSLMIGAVLLRRRRE